jgi:hypothetical protein
LVAHYFEQLLIQFLYMYTMILLLIIACVVIVYYYALYATRERIVVGSRSWNVVGSYDNAEDAAKLMASVNARMIKFMRVLKYKYKIGEYDSEPSGYTGRNDLRAIVQHMLAQYNPDEFYENDPRFSTETSYTVDKGRAMYICLRDKADPTKLVDEDTLFFTLLHEASHIANYNGWGHAATFWQVFKFILWEAQQSGVYTPVDYSAHPVWFCGLKIAWNPLFDDSVRSIWE